MSEESPQMGTIETRIPSRLDRLPAELLFGVKTEQKQPEDIAKPLSAQEQPPRRSRLRRYRPGPGQLSTSPGMRLWAPETRTATVRSKSSSERWRSGAAANRRELVRRVGGRYWGPGRFRSALRAAVYEGRVQRVNRDQYAPKGPASVG
jgi:hypothetical protein